MLFGPPICKLHPANGRIVQYLYFSNRMLIVLDSGSHIHYQPIIPAQRIGIAMHAST